MAQILQGLRVINLISKQHCNRKTAFDKPINALDRANESESLKKSWELWKPKRKRNKRCNRLSQDYEIFTKTCSMYIMEIIQENEKIKEEMFKLCWLRMSPN